MALVLAGRERSLHWDFPALATLQQVLGADGLAVFDPAGNLWHLAALLYALNAGERTAEAETALCALARISEATQAAADSSELAASLAVELRQAEALLTFSKMTHSQFVRLLPSGTDEVDELRQLALTALAGGG